MNEIDLKFPNILKTKKGNTYWEKEAKFDQFNVMITPFIKQTNNKVRHMLPLSKQPLTK